MNQILFAVIAITLVGILMIPINNIGLTRQDVFISTEAVITATAIGQELIEEVTVRKFDERKCGTGESATSPADFSLTAGVDSGENAASSSTFDDVDDYNNYHGTVPTPRLGNFFETCTVYYVADSNLNASAGVRTYYKRINVSVKNPYVNTSDSTITISKIVAYRYKT